MGFVSLVFIWVPSSLFLKSTKFYSQTVLCAIAVTTTFFEGQHFAGFARIFGVGLALFLVWKKVPLLLVICLAAAGTALIRLLGIE